jgi:hypothetical protein
MTLFAFSGEYFILVFGGLIAAGIMQERLKWMYSTSACHLEQWEHRQVQITKVKFVRGNQHVV